MNKPSRSTKPRRADYDRPSPQDTFIVSLLQNRINWFFTNYAMPLPNGRHVLDIGCGRQPFREKLESLGYVYTGLDVDQNPEGSVDIICAIDDSSPSELIGSSPFDLVICTEVLEHVARWDIAFHNIANVMVPGGHLLITCPHFYKLHEEPYDFWRATPHTIAHFAVSTGFKVLHQETAGDAWDIIGTLLYDFKPTPATARPSAKLATFFVKALRKVVFELLRHGYIQSMVRAEGPLYISNIAILERL